MRIYCVTVLFCYAPLRPIWFSVANTNITLIEKWSIIPGKCHKCMRARAYPKSTVACGFKGDIVIPERHCDCMVMHKMLRQRRQCTIFTDCFASVYIYIVVYVYNFCVVWGWGEDDVSIKRGADARFYARDTHTIAGSSLPYTQASIIIWPNIHLHTILTGAYAISTFSFSRYILLVCSSRMLCGLYFTHNSCTMPSTIHNIKNSQSKKGAKQQSRAASPQQQQR